MVSGAHFNPAVSLVQAKRAALSWSDAALYALVQVLGCCLGAILAHAMFALPLTQSSLHVCSGPAQWLSEAVATFGLLLVVLGHRRSEDAPWMVAAWIGAAYWFTASTSFANPAITIARSMTDTFSGIRPLDAPAFILAQIAGAVLALPAARLLFGLGPVLGSGQRLAQQPVEPDRTHRTLMKAEGYAPFRPLFTMKPAPARTFKV